MADGAGKKGQNWESNRIKHALHLPGWKFNIDSESVLKGTGKKVLVSEYQSEMKGDIFCPKCCCPLFRSPEKKEVNKGGRNAFYGHRKNIKTVCELRTKPAVGKKYLTEEEAAQAIVEGKLVVVKGFRKDKPESPEKGSGVYDQTAVEDEQGEVSEVAISRHRGKKFNLPSVLTTVRGLCNNFDENLYKYYLFPEKQHAQLLVDALRDVTTLSSTTDGPILGYGRIVSIYEPGKYPHSTRFVKLAFEAKEGYGDFSIMIPQQLADQRDLNTQSIGKFAIFYGSISVSGGGLSVKNIGWGEVSLLPAKYEKYLE
ncbi:hypothetical protein EI533_26140 [Pseudomonas donghuensis]|nr:hypothetical protein [Pseudomonas donghuensis]